MLPQALCGGQGRTAHCAHACVLHAPRAGSLHLLHGSQRAAAVSHVLPRGCIRRQRFCCRRAAAATAGAHDEAHAVRPGLCLLLSDLLSCRPCSARTGQVRVKLLICMLSRARAVRLGSLAEAVHGAAGAGGRTEGAGRPAQGRAVRRRAGDGGHDRRAGLCSRRARPGCASRPAPYEQERGRPLAAALWRRECGWRRVG